MASTDTGPKRGKTRTDTVRYRLDRAVLDSAIPAPKDQQAALLGVHFTTLYRWLSTKGVVIDLPAAERVAEILGVPVKEAWIKSGVSMTVTERKLRSSIAGNARRKKDTGADPHIGQRGLRAKYAREIDPDGNLPERELNRRVDNAIKEHMARMSLAASRQRRKAA
jgi:hypothetical protein